MIYCNGETKARDKERDRDRERKKERKKGEGGKEKRRYVCITYARAGIYLHV